MSAASAHRDSLTHFTHGWPRWVGLLACGVSALGLLGCTSKPGGAGSGRPQAKPSTVASSAPNQPTESGRSEEKPTATTKPGEKPIVLTSARRTDQDKAVAAILKLEGRFEIDAKHPDRPVIKVDFYNCKVSDADLALLEELPALQSLEFKGTAITDDGLKHLKGLTNLQTLSLDLTNITGQGLSHLTGLSKLRELDLSFTKITDSNLTHLQGLAGLQTLNLHLTEISDAGLKHLVGLKALRSLNLASTKVTDAGVHQLQQALPGLRIER